MLAFSAPAPAQETPYKVTLTGVEDADLRTLLESTATLFRLAEEPPPSPVGLNRRADTDRERLQTALRSAGHYDGKVEITVNTGVEPAEVTVKVEPGPVYRFDGIQVTGAEGRPLPGPPVTPESLELERDAPARAPAVVAAEERLAGHFAQLGHAYARVADRRVVVDHDRRTMNVTYTVAPGPKVRFGEIRVEGLEQIGDDLVRNRLPWRPGDVYDPDLLEKGRQEIADLGVFGSVRVQIPEQPPESAGDEVRVPVTVSAAERKRRFIGATVNFSTYEGFGGSAYWGHRNLFGGAEQLRIAAELGRIGAKDVIDRTDVRVTTDFRKPDFLMTDQSLLLSALAVSEKPAAYERDAVVVTAALERVLAEGLKVSYGVALEDSRTRETGGTTYNTLVGVPVVVAWDASNNLLNPTEGFRVSFGATPFVQLDEGGATFLITRLDNSYYYDVTGEGRYVAAVRLSLGSIVDGKTRGIPADKRFYTGGGGSIRGYGYQEVGPLDVAGDPVGGRSLVEVGAELRIKVTDTIGVVPFLDGGNVFPTTLPNFSEKLRWGTGLGLRYYTDFGPLRLDVGFPLNGREGVDDSWQLYISLGQAF